MVSPIAYRVTTIIAEQLCVDRHEVTPEARLGEQLGADSLDAIELTLSLEEDFGIGIPDEDALELQTVGDVIAYVERRTAAATKTA